MAVVIVLVMDPSLHNTEQQWMHHLPTLEMVACNQRSLDMYPIIWHISEFVLMEIVQHANEILDYDKKCLPKYP